MADYDELQQNRSLTPENKLSQQLQKRGVSSEVWHTLSKSLYPGALPESVLLVIDYCKARNLDPLKKPAHIVPMEVKDAKTGRYAWRDVVMPGIYELRITAHRTGEYLGHTKPAYGPKMKHVGTEAPEWCSMTFYRWNSTAERVVEFPVEVFFKEVVGTKKDKQSGQPVANKRWSQSPIQMLTKCTEAAGLRETFPEEIGGQAAHEEVGGGSIDAAAIDAEYVEVPSDPAAEIQPKAQAEKPKAARKPRAPATQAAKSAEPKAEEQEPAESETSPESDESQQSFADDEADNETEQESAEREPGSDDDLGEDNSPMPDLSFSEAFQAIAKARSADDLDVIRSQIKNLNEKQQANLSVSIENKMKSLASRGSRDGSGLNVE
jgi:phage recombination protein Bet